MESEPQQEPQEDIFEWMDPEGDHHEKRKPSLLKVTLSSRFAQAQ